MKKISVIAVILCAVLMCSIFASCGDPGPKQGTILIHVVEKGYGRTWLENIAEAFKDKFDIEVDILESGLDDNFASLQVRRNTDIDIFITTSNLALPKLAIKNYAPKHDKCWLDLSDVFNAPAEGYEEAEENPNLKIKDIYDPLLMQAATYTDGKQYVMHHTTRLTGLVYNKTMWDSYNAKLRAAGQAEFELPKTTEELWALFDRILDLKHSSVPPDYRIPEGVYAYLYTSVDYSIMAYMPWWAQYEGKENMDNYVMGKDENGEYSPQFYGSAGKLYSYKNLQTLIRGSSNGKGKYSSDNDQSANFKQGQINFLRGAAFFMFNGDWFEREAYADYNFNGDIAYIRLPVVSEIMLNPKIKDDFSGGMTSANDAKLSNVIEFIDEYIDDNVNKPDLFDENGHLNIENKQTAISALNVSVSTFDFITEARRYSHDTQADAAVLQVPVYTNAKDEVKLFLQYMYSKEAQEIMMQSAYGLMCPIRVNMEQFDYFKNIPTSFSLSKLNLWETGSVIARNMNYSKLNYLGGMEYYAGSSFAYSLFAGKNYQQVFETSRDEQYELYKDAYKKAFGEEWVDPYQ